MTADRINQLDLRVGKLVHFHGVRTQFSVDLYNALNSNPIQTYNTTYGSAWLAPTVILQARFADLGVQIDF